MNKAKEYCKAHMDGKTRKQYEYTLKKMRLLAKEEVFDEFELRYCHKGNKIGDKYCECSFCRMYFTIKSEHSNEVDKIEDYT